MIVRIRRRGKSHSIIMSEEATIKDIMNILRIFDRRLAVLETKIASTPKKELPIESEIIGPENQDCYVGFEDTRKECEEDKSLKLRNSIKVYSKNDLLKLKPSSPTNRSKEENTVAGKLNFPMMKKIEFQSQKSKIFISVVIW